MIHLTISLVKQKLRATFPKTASCSHHWPLRNKVSVTVCTTQLTVILKSFHPRIASSAFCSLDSITRCHWLPGVLPWKSVRNLIILISRANLYLSKRCHGGQTRVCPLLLRRQCCLLKKENWHRKLVD